MSRSAAAPQQKPEPMIPPRPIRRGGSCSHLWWAMLVERRGGCSAPGAVGNDHHRPGDRGHRIVADGEHRRVVLNPTRDKPRVAFLANPAPSPFSKLNGLTNLPSARPPASIRRFDVLPSRQLRDGRAARTNSSLTSIDGVPRCPQPNDLSRSLVALVLHSSTIIAVVEISQSSWLVGGAFVLTSAAQEAGAEPAAAACPYCTRPAPAMQ